MHSNEDAKKLLIETIEREQAVLMCGAGSSKLVEYPLWAELLSGMAAKCKPPLMRLSDESVLDYAERIKSSLGEDDYFNHLGVTFEPRSSRNFDEVHLALVQLGFCGIVTTNYDEVLEFAVREAFRTDNREKVCNALDLCSDRTYNVLRFLRGLSKAPDHKFVLHLHGVHSAPNKIVLAKSDYAYRYGEQGGNQNREDKLAHRILDTLHRKVLWTLLATHPMVFVGFSMEDEFFDQILRIVQVDLQSGSAPLHFVILAQKTGEDIIRKTEYLQKKGVQPVYYPVPPPQTNDGPVDYVIGLRKLIFEIAQELGVSTGPPGSADLTRKMLDL